MNGHSKEEVAYEKNWIQIKLEDPNTCYWRYLARRYLVGHVITVLNSVWYYKARILSLLSLGIVRENSQLGRTERILWQVSTWKLSSTGHLVRATEHNTTNYHYKQKFVRAWAGIHWQQITQAVTWIVQVLEEKKESKVCLFFFFFLCFTSVCCSGSFILSKIRNTILNRSCHQCFSKVWP